MESRDQFRGRRVRAVVAEVLRSPLVWGMGAGAWLLGMAVDQSLLAMGAAMATPGIAVAVALRDPNFTRHALQAQSETEARRLLGRLSEDTMRVDPVTRERLDSILEAYVAICNECAAPDVPRYARIALADTSSQINRLAVQASDLARRRNELSTFLEGVNRSELHGQQASLRARAQSAHDPVLKAQLEQALRFKAEEIGAYEAILLAIQRIDSQLESVECAFAALKARILRFRSDEKTEWATAGEALRGEMDTLSRQIDTLDSSVREVLTLRGGAAGQ